MLSEPNDYQHSQRRRAAKQHTCCECHTPILPGEHYEYGTALFDGRWANWKLCLSCLAWAEACGIDSWEIGCLSKAIAEKFDKTPWPPLHLPRQRTYYVNPNETQNKA